VRYLTKSHHPVCAAEEAWLLSRVLLGEDVAPMSQTDLSTLQGTWRMLGSESPAYGRMVGGELRFAYRFGGNPRMTGQMFDWRQVGDALVARFKWVDGTLSGFVYLKAVNNHRLEGGWWSALSNAPHPLIEQGAPPARMVRSIWERQPNSGAVPEWAERIFAQV
jgi:hypothetical protein